MIYGLRGQECVKANFPEHDLLDQDQVSQEYSKVSYGHAMLFVGLLHLFSRHFASILMAEHVIWWYDR